MSLTRRQFAQALAIAAAHAAWPRRLRAQASERRLRVAISAETLAGANINDARAASKVWVAEIERTLGLGRAATVPEVYLPSQQMVEMIRAGTIDCFALTAWEYAKVVSLIDPTWVLVEDAIGEGLEYVLIAHSASSFHSVEDLHDSQLAIYLHRDTALLPAWLSILLADKKQRPLDSFFLNQASRTNAAQVLLPVFFRRMDAAAITRRAFNTAVELNPQLGRDLRVLAVSPRVIPDCFCFRKGCKEGDMRELKDSLLRLTAIPAGQQIMALYQTAGYVARGSECMKGTLDLMRKYERLRAQQEAASRKSRS